MKYFMDTEFNEMGGSPLEGKVFRPTIDLISIGIVDEQGREYYAESSDFAAQLCNPWVKENVLPLLGRMIDRKPNRVIAKEIIQFVGANPDSGHFMPEFWAYYADYDWVVFCWLFGAMVDLPKGFPMLCMDLQQWWIQLGRPEKVKPRKPQKEHNSLVDANWNRELHHNLTQYQKMMR